VAAVDIDGVLRGKYISMDKFKSVVSGGISYCSVVWGWDIDDKLYDNNKFVGEHTGYPDFHGHLGRHSHIGPHCFTQQEQTSKVNQDMD
jgi:glutamine synthetase